VLQGVLRTFSKQILAAHRTCYRKWFGTRPLVIRKWRCLVAIYWLGRSCRIDMPGARPTVRGWSGAATAGNEHWRLVFILFRSGRRRRGQCGVQLWAPELSIPLPSHCQGPGVKSPNQEMIMRTEPIGAKTKAQVTWELEGSGHQSWPIEVLSSINERELWP